MSEIKKIILDVEGKEVELTLDQAKSLYGLLKEMFDKEEKFVPYPYPVYLYYPELWWRKPYITWEIICADNSNSMIVRNSSGTLQ